MDRVVRFAPSDALVELCGPFTMPPELRGMIDRLLLRAVVQELVWQCNPTIEQKEAEIAAHEDPVKAYWERRTGHPALLRGLREAINGTTADTIAGVEFQAVMMLQYLDLEPLLRGSDWMIGGYKGTGEISDDLTLLSAWGGVMAVENSVAVLHEMIVQWFPPVAESCAYVGPTDLFGEFWPQIQEAGRLILTYDGEEKRVLNYTGREVVDGYYAVTIEEAVRHHWYPVVVQYESWAPAWAEYARLLTSENPLLLPDHVTMRLMMERSFSSGRAVASDFWFHIVSGYNEFEWRDHPDHALQLRAMPAYDWKFAERFDCPR